ncbi:MAG: sigma 54-interacting transcriptional regulator [Syntrophaceae bacterium]|nr:sigma 54-interacting transcriptional regulator [Syntrophaceae bacterium]
MYYHSNGNSGFDGQKTLVIASLFRDDFCIDWLVDLLADLKPSQILAQLEQGVADGSLVRKEPGYYGFASDKKRKRLRATLDPREEKRLHGYIADILMRQLPDNEEKAHAVAHHLIHILNDANRCRYLIKAGDLHLEAFRPEEALQCYSKALEDLAALTGREADGLFSETAIKYSKISTARHDTMKVLSILESALEKATRWKVDRARALLKMHMAKNEWLRSRYGSALRHFEEGWALAQELNDPRVLQSATTFSAFFLFWQGRFQEAVRMYEKAVPDIERYPQGGFPLLAVMTVGYCYAQIGQVTQGLGMLDALRNHGLGKGDLYLAAYTAGNIGNVMLEIGRVDEAIRYLEDSAKMAKRAHNDWVWITGKMSLAYAYYLKGDTEQSLQNLREFLHHTRKVHTTVYLYPYLLELRAAMDRGELPAMEELCLDKDIQAMIGGHNIFLKGVAYRFQAQQWQREGRPREEVIRSLRDSIANIEESGQQIELAKSRLELARQYLAEGDREEAKVLTVMTSETLDAFNDKLIPDELRILLGDRPAGESLLREILNLGQKVVTIQDNRDLVQHILSTLNRITGAERSAIFLLEGVEGEPRPVLRASKNLTSEQVSHGSFASSLKIIEEVAATGKGRILADGTPEKGNGSPGAEVIRSRICVPMILRDKTVGVLYHDNRLLSSAFRESDLDLLSYFAALAAFALDNARAYDEIQRLNRKLCEENLYYKEEHLQNLHFDDIIGDSPGIHRVLAQIDQVTGTDATVMIIGETGVGKELVARAIHRHSTRRDKPFIKVNCSALPESLIPSELFGHEKGAFTGAIRRRLGRFELADGGTLFLDEIGEISLDLQVRLLRVLQTREFERVGGSETIRSDFRLLVATNRNLEMDVKTQKFRPDLYYRLAVFPIYVPPLRERREDIPLLAFHFLRIYAQKRGKEFTKIPEVEMEKLLDYEWPGNVRELENIIERGTILNPGPVFRVPELGSRFSEAPPPGNGVSLMDNERRHILWALQKTKWKVRGKGGAAELLELPPSTLAFRMKKLGIQRPETSS